ncbi:MAG: hypothetical protein OJF52_000480 [Nitrospira sp.]|nr:MAG: hypothetical protein OJF52_000480 [Nitrospira sp.]
MRCPRCYSGMAMLKLKDIVNGTSLYGWVCRQCGTVIDSLIDTHRQWHLEPRATWAYMARASC